MLKRILAPTLFCILSGCSYSQEKGGLTAGYALTQPEVFRLPGVLSEISGIALRPDKPDTLYAIQDEDGTVFTLVWNQPPVKHTPFAGKGDYEDLAIFGDLAVVMKSNGTLYSFPLSEINTIGTRARKWDDLVPKGEYEGIFGDEKTGMLYVLCKKCGPKKSEKGLAGYVLSSGNGMERTGKFSIDVEQIEAIAGKMKQSFQPSALAKNPLTEEWYILSSVNRLLLIADTAWQIEHAFHLPAQVFTQPEGIAFDQDGTLYISNEGGKFSSGNILKFKRN